MSDVDNAPSDPTGTVDADSALAAMLDLTAPQERYAEMIPEGVSMPIPGLAIPASREAVDTVLRHHEIFTSEFGLDLGNT
ncbi:MAG TPA: hypothetical protein VNG12_25205, partial [Acidimicrobiales bacterium]|nr:hypothetical protein [Acidimicrobiales bacterium]